MNRLFSLVIAILLLVSCENSVKFETPQPSGQSNLIKIPKRLRGTYMSTSDSAFLKVGQQSIVKWMELSVNILTDSIDFEIDSTKIVKKAQDFFSITDGGETYDFKIFGDSVEIHWLYQDTIFEISDKHLIRRFKGHYFLNYQLGEANWNVKRLTLSKGELSFSKIKVPEDITHLQEIAEVQEIKSDSSKAVGYKMNPTRKEMKKLMQRSFSETGTYRRID